MSAADDINTNKDEEDLLNDSVHINAEKSPVNNTSKDSTKEPSCIDSVIGSKAEAVSKNVIQDSNMESGHDAAEILGKNAMITTDDSVSKKLLTYEVGKGDSEHTASIAEVCKPELIGDDNTTDECKKVEKEPEILDADELEDDDLELKWDDDDCNIDTPEDHAEKRDTEASVECSSHSANKTELISEENKVESQVDDIKENTTEELEKNMNPVDLKENKLKENNAEIDLEEKLLEKTVAPTERSVTPAKECFMEINEDELLKDDPSVGVETMDVDLSVEEGTVAKTIEEIPDSKSVRSITDNTNNTKENDECLHPKTPNNDELKENVDKHTPDEDNKFKNSTLNENIEDINDDSQELNLSMEVDLTDISVNSPGPLTSNYRLHKPDVMLEIPTQELIDIDDVLDSPNCTKLDDSVTNDDLIDDDDIDNDTKIDDAISNDRKINAGIIDDENNRKEIYDAIANDEKDKSIDNAPIIDDAVANDHKINEDTAIDEKNAGDNAIDEQIDSEIGNDDVIEKQEEAVTKIDMVTKCQEKVEVDDEKSKIDDTVEKETSVVQVEQIAMKAPIEDAPPSTSESTLRMIPDTSDEVPEMSDSLGLLAESCRVMGRDDDDEADDDEEGDVDDDDDFDHDDESSNQMTGDHSEDSNAPHSETEPTKCEQEKEIAEDLEETEMEIREEEEIEEDGMIDKCEEDFECEDDIDIDEEDNMSINVETIASGKEAADDNKVKEEPLLPETKNAELDKKIKIEENIPKLTDTEKIERDNAIEAIVTKEKENTIEEVVIKKEKDDAIVTKAVLKQDRAKAAEDVITKNDDSSKSSVTSNDDVIEQPIEVETVKVSDDEDDVPPKSEVKEDLPIQKNDSTVNTEVNTSVKEKVDVSEVITSSEKLETVKEVSKDTAIPESTAKDESSKDVENIEESQPTTDSNKQSPKSSPSKLKNLSLSSMVNSKFLSIVELGESSSEDDVQETETPPEHTISQLQKLLEGPSPDMTVSPLKDVTTVNIPTGIEIMSTSVSGGNRSEIVTKEGEVVISGVSKPPPLKPARLNTSEVTIKTASNSEQTLVIPEAKVNESDQPVTKGKPKLSLEIFSLDSDEEDTTAKEAEKPTKKPKKCINSSCLGGFKTLRLADASTAAYYDASKKKRPLVCDVCAETVTQRQQKLIDGIRNMTPLLQLEIPSIAQDLVEILDSESEDEETTQDQSPKETIGEETAKFLEENLADLLNDTWKKHNLDERLKETKDELNAEILKLEEESREINQMLVDCQRVTDKLRYDLYATFEQRIQETPSLLIYDTPDFNYIGPETEKSLPVATAESRLSAKRKQLTQNEMPAKRPAIPLGYTPLDDSKAKAQEQKSVDNKLDDDKDISVVKLSAESAPADLPPPGELSRPPLRVGMPVYAMKNAFGPWLKGKILEVLPKSSNPAAFTSCRVKFDHKEKNNGKVLSSRCIAYAEPSSVRMTIGTRLIALFKDANKGESYYSGVVAEIPNPVNSYRYLVFFDDGYAQYVQHPFTRLVCECSPLVWEEVHPFSREFVREYLMAYPERPMVRLHQGQHLKTEWDGKWWSSRVTKVDASLAQVVFIGDGRREWIYRGSTRLAPLYLELRAAERHRPRPMPRSKQPRSNMMPYVEYTRSDEQAAKTQEARVTPVTTTLTAQQQNEEIRRQRAVAKKSTSVPSAPVPAPHTQAPTAGNLDTVTSRVVYYTPKNAVRPYKLTPHKCSSKCKRNDVLSLKELRTYNPLAKPLLSGWERQIVRFKGQKEVMYRAPCGRRLRNMRELHRYLRMTESDLPVDLFDFYHATHCLAEFVLNKCLVGKKDLSHGKENVPVPCVNYYDDSLPEFCSYNTERTPTSGVPLNLDPEFLCGCDCTDDCEDKSKCACWKMTLEGARTIGLEGPNIGYKYKRLPEPLPSGIYECNSRCKCKQTCLNRVAQHPLQLKLQVFKTLNRGWGIRALNDVPKGAFLCVYAGNLLTDATANLDGLNEGDEYLAELDYIEVVEQMKEGYEEDIPDADKKLDKDGIKQEDTEEEPTSSEEDETNSKNDKEDDDFRPGFIMGPNVSEFKKSLRKRKRNEKKDEDADGKEKDSKSGNPDEDCITISDDEEIREPSSFSAKPGMGGNDFISKYRSVRTLFGEDEACYIMDAKVQGNIGRYLNHSCLPNVFVQNVFVDTHDPRFPWVAFFALSHIKAGTELTWNYNYDVGSVPGKTLYCYCEAPNCRGRLL